MNRSFQYKAQIQEIPQIRNDLEFLKKEWSVPESEIRQILVIIEELFSNIVRFAYNDQQEHKVDIKLTSRNHEIEIEIVDDGIPFNPLNHENSRLSDPATSDAGGMGLTLIRAFSSNIAYQRNSGQNHLTIIKKIKAK